MINCFMFDMQYTVLFKAGGVYSKHTVCNVCSKIIIDTALFFASIHFNFKFSIKFRLFFYARLLFFPRSLRYAAYRQFNWWIYTHLGKGNRRVIPSCVLWSIRSCFEEQDGVYVLYSEGAKD